MRNSYRVSALWLLGRIASHQAFRAWVLIKFSKCTGKFFKLTYAVFPKTMQLCCFHLMQLITKIIKSSNIWSMGCHEVLYVYTSKF